VGTLLALASLIVLALILWAAWTRGRAREAISDAGLTGGRVVSVDAIQEREELAGMRQINIRSVRYGIAGKPDRVVQTDRGPAPVDVKKCFCPRNGHPYEGHVAQLAVYCLLLEDKFQCRVHEGVIDYIDRSVTVPFDEQLRMWILSIIHEVQETKRNHVIPMRSHNHRGKCGACGFRQECREALH
jgi:CRISPR-associated protein Cas4